MLKRSDNIQNNIKSKEKYIEKKKMNDKTFTNSSKLKILKYSLSIKDENVISHRRTFKNSYSSLWELIVAIDFNVSIDLIKYNIRCIIFFCVSKEKMYFASIDKSDDVRFHKIAMTFLMICDFFSWQSEYKKCLEKLLFEWNKSKHFTIEWSLLSHEIQSEW